MQKADMFSTANHYNYLDEAYPPRAANLSIALLRETMFGLRAGRRSQRLIWGETWRASSKTPVSLSTMVGEWLCKFASMQS